MNTATAAQPILAADGTPLKRSLARALRRQKLMALVLIAPLLAFVLLTFVSPIINMLFRSVENTIVVDTLPGTVESLQNWQPSDSAPLPPEHVFRAAYYDLFAAKEAKEHTKLGSRLNYEQVGAASTFRRSARALDRPGQAYQTELAAIDPAWNRPEHWSALFAAAGQEAEITLPAEQIKRLSALKGREFPPAMDFAPAAELARALPLATREYTYWAAYQTLDQGKDISREPPWEALFVALADDLTNPAQQSAIAALSGANAAPIQAAAHVMQNAPAPDYVAILSEANASWGESAIWETIKLHAPRLTAGYFLNAVDMRKTADGPAAQPEDKRILLKLFERTIWMSLIITISCILLAYPVAWLLANLPNRTSNLLMILVLLPFWTSLLVRTSAWKVMLQQYGIINEALVWLGVIADANRLDIFNNQFATIIAMTHILLPFMILPMYSVMQTIPPSYVRAAKSLGATNWTAFWRVYFPLSVPGIGAGAILVFILAIGYYITPEIVGGTDGVFISNRIAYHISRSLNWGLAAALGTILLVAVLILYWAYDRVVGIDNVKLG